MRSESERGALTKLYKAFQASLIHELTEESFADTYAQTITYGLLTAAISRTEMSEGTAGTVPLADDISDMVPVTNPFLKEMLQTFLKVGGRKGGIDFDELGIQDVVELLRGDETDLPAILRDFGNKTRGEDPVIHFYEHFLSAYNKQLKIQRGVFYTPQRPRTPANRVRIGRWPRLHRDVGGKWSRAARWGARPPRALVRTPSSEPRSVTRGRVPQRPRAGVLP